MIRNRTVRLLFVCLCALPLFTPPGFSDGNIFVGVYPSGVAVLDEATGQLQGQIPLKNGLAGSITLSTDRTKLIVINSRTEGIEVIDIKSRQVVDTFKLSAGNRQVRLRRNPAVHPDGVRLFSVIVASVKQVDRFTMENPQIVTIDLREKKITKSLELPREYSGNGLMRVSPDGKTLFFIFRDILMIDVDSFKIVGKIDLRDRPMIPGTGYLDLGTSYETFDQPGKLYYLFTSADPATNQKIQGIAQLNLVTKSLDFFETNPDVALSGFAVSPDGKRAYGVRADARYNEFYVYDLEAKRLIKRLEYAGRSRTTLSISSDGKNLYLAGAGSTIDYVDAETLAPIGKHIDLPGDVTSSLFVFPR
jgi:DNA-binding beta-propeller fold protein YncE